MTCKQGSFASKRTKGKLFKITYKKPSNRPMRIHYFIPMILSKGLARGLVLSRNHLILLMW